MLLSHSTSRQWSLGTTRLAYSDEMKGETAEPHLLRRRRTRNAIISDTAYPAGLTMPTHVHQAATISMVLVGGYQETVGKARLQCGPSRVIFRPANREHAVRFGPTRTRILNVQLTASLIEYARYAHIPLDSVADMSGTRSSWLIARLHDEFRRTDPVSDLALDALVLDMLVELGRARRGRDSSQSLKGIEAFIQRNLDERITLNDLAQRAGMHPVSLARAFRRVRGCTIGTYVRRIKLERATELLTTSNLTISEIARELGFSDQAHFTRVFKSETGFTPGLCQRAHCES